MSRAMIDIKKTAAICEFIHSHVSVNTVELRARFPDDALDLHAFLRAPLRNGYLVRNMVLAPDSRGTVRTLNEYHVFIAALPYTYDEWKRLKPAGNPVSARRQGASQPKVEQNIGSARLVASSSVIRAEARTVALPPACSVGVTKMAKQAGRNVTARIHVRLPSKSDLLANLTQSGNLGANNGITARRLSARMSCPERHVRTLVTQLREDGIAVCGKPRDGYYIACNAREVEDTCKFLRGRAMQSLHLEARLRRVPLPELIGQLRLET
jgi:biotin operon repressor